MKKRLTLILLVVALLVAAAVFTVQADETTTPTNLDLTTFNCPCSKCGGKPYTGTWITSWKWPMADGDHVYLSNGSATPSSTLGHNVTGEFVLVLDNYTINSTVTGRVFTLAKGTMHIVGNNGVLQGKSMSSTTGTGGLIQVYNDSGAGVLNLHGTETGTLTI